jgi:hypothetical protein
MNIFRSHIALMFIYAVASGIFFSLLWKDDRKEQIRFFIILFCSLFLGGIAVGWLMFPFPIR